MTRRVVIIVLQGAVLFMSGAAVTVVLSLFLTRAQMLAWQRFTEIATGAAALFTMVVQLAG